MRDVYEVAGISRQALHQHRIRQLKADRKTVEIFEQVDKLRKEHPGAGCRKMALDLACKGWGRDRLEQLFLSSGYRLYRPQKFTRTTDRRREFYYSNLIEGIELDNINQVVQTDITYIYIGGKFFYIVFLIDVYSRRIVGHAVSRTLAAEGNIKALQGMLKLRGKQLIKGLIHHSDRGTQYTALRYRKLLEDYGIIPSMCGSAWENAYTERVNRTIKEEYLERWQICDYRSLCKRLNQAVNHYNCKRKHDSLGKVSPLAFEEYVKNLDTEKRPKHIIYKHLDNYQQKECE
jgi:putative transposase